MSRCRTFCSWRKKDRIGLCGRVRRWLTGSTSARAGSRILRWRQPSGWNAPRNFSRSPPASARKCAALPTLTGAERLNGHGRRTFVETVMATPLVALLMGSDSDLPTVKEACGILRAFEVPFEVRVLSAHRCPEDLVTFVKDAEQR